MDMIPDTINHAGGVLLIWEGVAFSIVVGIFLGAALGMTIAGTIKNRGDVRAGQGLYLGAQSRFVEAICITFFTVIVPVVLFLASRHFARVNFPGYF